MLLQKHLICMDNFPMLEEKLFMKPSKLFVARMLHLSLSLMEMFILAAKDPMEDLVMDILMTLAIFKSFQVSVSQPTRNFKKNPGKKTRQNK